MEEVLVSPEVAKLAKEKGFNEQTPFFYTEESTICCFHSCELFYGVVSKEEDKQNYLCNSADISVWDSANKIRLKNKVQYDAKTFFTFKCTAPTQSLLQKWLFEQHNIWVNVQPDYGNTWWYTLDKFESTENKRIYGGRNVGTNKWPCGEYLSPYIALEEGLKHALNLI